MSNFLPVWAFVSRYHDFLLLTGAFGAVLMFVADLVLYYPMATDAATPSTAVANGRRNDSNGSSESVLQYRTAESYFSTVDPGGDNIAESSMRHVSIRRVMLGGVMGPISSVFYSVGFLGVFLGLTSSQQQLQQEHSSNDNYPMIIPAAIAALGLSLQMTIGGAYHIMFAYTCFLSKEISAATNGSKKNDNDGSNICAAASVLHKILGLHQAYQRYVFKWAAASCIVGSLAYAYCCLTVATSNSSVGYTKYSVLFAPVLSGPVKKTLKKFSVGGIVLCGGLTNLWHLCFFVVLYLGFCPPVM